MRDHDEEAGRLSGEEFGSDEPKAIGLGVQAHDGRIQEELWNETVRDIHVMEI